MRTLNRKLTTALLIAVILSTAGTGYAQVDTPEPTPTLEAEVTETPPVVVIVEAPPAVEPPPADNTVSSFLLAGVVFGAIWLAREIFKQHGLNLDIVAKTVPIEFSQFAFRRLMEGALQTPELYDDEAIKEAAKQAGYEVFTDANGAFTIRASAQAVAQNVAKVEQEAKEDYQRLNR